MMQVLVVLLFLIAAIPFARAVKDLNKSLSEGQSVWVSAVSGVIALIGIAIAAVLIATVGMLLYKVFMFAWR